MSRQRDLVRRERREQKQQQRTRDLAARRQYWKNQPKRYTPGRDATLDRLAAVGPADAQLRHHGLRLVVVAYAPIRWRVVRGTETVVRWCPDSGDGFDIPNAQPFLAWSWPALVHLAVTRYGSNPAPCGRS